MMLRASTARAPLICSECLAGPSTLRRRTQSTSASAGTSTSNNFESSSASPGGSSFSNRAAAARGGASTPNTNKASSSLPPRRNSQPGPPRQFIKRDWRAAGGSSTSAGIQQERTPYNNNSNSYNNYNNRSQQASPPFRGGMRRDEPRQYQGNFNNASQRQARQPDFQQRNSNSNNRDDSSSYSPSFSSGGRLSSEKQFTGHRANQKSHGSSSSSSATATSNNYASSSNDKDKPKQVNFGAGSALAAFAMKKQQQQQQALAASASAASANGGNNATTPAPAVKPQMKRTVQKKAKKTIEIPATVSVNALAQVLGMKLRRLQFQMEKMGIEDTRADKLLSTEDASLVAGELGYQVEVVDDETGFDIYPSPPHENPSLLELRPPIVTIMGHVDHGKTSLLDALRSTKVAAGEAGGITQHIGAFNVPLSSLITSSPSNLPDPSSTEVTGSITFLDTPGHAAFAAMRSRGASVTDVAVLVVAADDGVKPQTKEVIDLVKNEDVGLVVAITKCDKHGIDIPRVHTELFSHGLEVEPMGGEVPCVQVSAHSKVGLDDLVETINAVAEVRDLRAESEGIPSEGRIIESRVDKGKGNVTTLIVTRGTLKVGATIIAGKAFGKVRQLISGDGKDIQEAGPGTPVEVSGWKVLPEAGDQVLEAKSEEDAKKAIETRKRREERRKEIGDLEAINEKRRIMAEANVIRKKMREEVRSAGINPNTVGSAATFAASDENEGIKVLNLIVKSDFAGTEEAVSNALAEVGNSQARVKIVETGVGDITDGDLALAKAVDGVIVGFNVKASRQIISTAQQISVPILQNNVIYRLIEDVKERVIELLPKLYDQRVLGEAAIQQVFKYTIKGSGTQTIAGCRVTNGSLTKKNKIRVMRDGEMIFEGNMASLKHHKEEAQEIRKGNECGVLIDGFDGFAVDDVLQCYEDVERKRSL